MINDDLLGMIVLSKAGRDKGKYFIIVGIIDQDYVYISNGDSRRIDKPKKKKVKHIFKTKIVSQKIRESLLKNKTVNNSDIKKFLQTQCMNKEV